MNIRVDKGAVLADVKRCRDALAASAVVHRVSEQIMYDSGTVKVRVLSVFLLVIPSIVSPQVTKPQ
jgi:hypothetical protein